MRCAIWYHLYNLKKVKNTHGGILILVLKLTLLHGCFSRFLNCANDTKSRNAPHMEYLPLKAGLLKQVLRPGATLIKTVKQPYGVCCLTGHIFKVGWCEQYEDYVKKQSLQLRLPKFLGRVLSLHQAQWHSQFDVINF